MFGIGFSEILVILVIGIIFLGPDKLPEAMIKIAKIFKALRKVVNEAKETIDQELKIQDLKAEALEYKKKLEETTQNVRGSMYVDEFQKIKNTTNDITGSIKENIQEASALTKKENKKPQKEPTKESQKEPIKEIEKKENKNV